MTQHLQSWLVVRPLSGEVMRVFKRLAAASVVVLTAVSAGLASAPPAGAFNPSVSIATTISGARLLQDCSQGASAETWQVSLSVKVRNGSEGPVTFRDTEYWAKYTSASAGPNRIQRNITLVDSGGFVAGTQLAQNQTRIFTPVVQVSLPCDTKGADMFAGLHLVGNDKQYSDGNTFIG